MENLNDGIYENLLTDKLREELNALDQTLRIARLEAPDDALTADYLTRTLAEHMKRSLHLLLSRIPACTQSF
jgi:hypothetical protein